MSTGEDCTAPKPEWRATLLDGLAFTALGLGTLAFPLPALAALGGGRTVWFGGLIALYLLVAATALARRLSFRVRAHALLFCVGTLALLGFMRVGFQVGPGVGSAAIVVLAGLLLGRTTMLAAFVFNVLAIFAIGQYHVVTHGSFLAPSSLDPTLFANWIRTGVMYAFFTGVLAVAVTFVVSHIERSLIERSDALARLHTARAQRREAVDALDDAQRTILQMQKMEAVGRLAGGVAHDFNNALVVILGWADLLRARAADPERLQAGLSEIVSAATRAAGLTKQLLAFGRKGLLIPRAVAPAELIDELVRMLRPLLTANIEIRSHVDPSLPAIFADPSQMHQVLLNLCVNARDAMPDGGVLEIDAASLAAGSPVAVGVQPCERVGDWVEVSVRDDGIGMDEATQARLFEPYFTTKGEFGTGLGLASVYGIVQQSGGHIEVTSAPGRGTRFSLRLPGCSNSFAGAAAMPSMRAAAVRGSTILIAEDELPVRNLITITLQAAGHTVLAAEDGGRALELARRFRGVIDLLCTDGAMPGISSANLIADFQRLFPRAPILVCSGHIDQNLHGQLAGSRVRYLDKPFTSDDLVAAVERALAERV
jgi:signal transduction histidine kinase